MSSEAAFTKENLDLYLRELGKEYRRVSGKAIPAEIILIGGASILANYGFREMTYDMDAVIVSSSAMNDAINHVGDKFNLPNGWMNTDFTSTKSFTNKLSEVSVYYRTYSNILTVRMVSAEYLIAMKLMAGRKYKNDLSDIVGILWEHQKSGKPINREAVAKAIAALYVDWDDIPVDSKAFIDGIFDNGNYEAIYTNSRISEAESRNTLLEFERQYPEANIKEENIDAILERAKELKNRNLPQQPKESVLAKIREARENPARRGANAKSQERDDTSL